MIFLSDDDKFSQEYCMYFKKICLSMTEKEPFKWHFGGYRIGLILTNKRKRSNLTNK